MVVARDGRVWISHGFTFAGRFDDTRAYDLGTKRWVNKTPDGRLPGEALSLSGDRAGLEADRIEVRFGGDEERAAKVYEGMTPLLAEDVADCIVYAATRPPHVNIDEIVVRPRDQAAATVVHRTPTGD